MSNESIKMEIEGKNILVTGGAGFIGSTLVRELLKENANVVVYDNFFSGDEENLEEVKDKIKIVKGDIRDSDFEKTLTGNEINLVFHLAAEPYIPSCYDRPETFFDINATGTLNIMMSCLRAKVERVLLYSTSEVYGTLQKAPMDEDHPLFPQSTYAVSKLAADRLCFTLHHEQKLPVIIQRQFNVYGPRETHPYIIPELITQLSNSSNLKLGNIKASRDFTYVEDAAKGAIAVMKCDELVGQVVNLGYGEDNTIEELANIIGELMGHDSVNIEVEQRRLRPLDVERLQCDTKKVKALTEWAPKIGLKEGLQKTIEWYNQNGKKWIWEKKTKFVREE